MGVLKRLNFRVFHNVFMFLKIKFLDYNQPFIRSLSGKGLSFYVFLKLFVRGLLFSTGYLLSPLSWWNDLIINVPLAYVFAILFSSLSGGFFAFWFSLGYTLSNIIGILLMKFSVSGYSGSWIRDLIYSIAYSVVAYVILSVFLAGL